MDVRGPSRTGNAAAALARGAAHNLHLNQVARHPDGQRHSGNECHPPLGTPKLSQRRRRKPLQVQRELDGFLKDRRTSVGTRGRARARLAREGCVVGTEDVLSESACDAFLAISDIVIARQSVTMMISLHGIGIEL
eukprot:3115640-Rhodomonas_salina.3